MFGTRAGPGGSNPLPQPSPPPPLSPPQPSFHHSTPAPSPGGPEFIERACTPLFAYEGSGLASIPQQYTGIPRRPEAVERVRSQPLAYESSGFASTSQQHTGMPMRPEGPQRVRSPPLAFESMHSTAGSSYPSVGAHRPVESPSRWVNGQRSLFKGNAGTNQRPSAVTSFVASQNSGTGVTAKIARFQDLKRSRSPPSHSMDTVISRNSSQPSLQRPALSPSARNNRPNFPGTYPNLLPREDRSSVLPYVDSFYSGKSFMNEAEDVQAPKRTRSPPVPPANDVFKENVPFVQKEFQRSSMSPSRLDSRSNALFSNSDSEIPWKPLASANNTAVEAIPTRTMSLSVPKRTRSPPLPSADKIFQGNSYSAQDGTEREMQAKAKRLARFKEELSDGFENGQDVADRKVYTSRREHSMVEKQKFARDHSMESPGDFNIGNISSDYEGLESSSIIIGLCPDMCPESERAERERKGDLDQYERLDGDRNQTNQFIAVKKYNRTAEREANLIRPMPILQKTIDYLLNLLDQPYDDRFLGTYNFLWDRMRAIRMDLRMQHIFNREAITMLEQMIRLHIIAMHELCENTNGEGFSEGFDAHLNIEQMNKTSVELFQMYDDHRKKGINVPTEKEFRGYYALLKLDKHPGYKVEPAELSLDLAKMTPEIRQTPEVLFARDVARACRTGNFIAFFRLARKASYLQACLMHAHFAKLRTQALASLHSGLQNNQGLPVAHVAKWLAMEEENIEGLFEYHGFLIKEFEEPYMVKEGPFFNGGKDYTTKCSELVHRKKSRMIVEDVSPTSQEESLPLDATKEFQLPKIYNHDTTAVTSISVDRKSSVQATDEEMPDLEVVSSPKLPHIQPMMEKSIVDRNSQDDYRVVSAYSAWGFSLPHSCPASQPVKLGILDKPHHDTPFRDSPERKMFSDVRGVPLQTVSKPALQERSPSGKYGYPTDNSTPQIMVINDSKYEEPPDINQENENDDTMEKYQDEEVARAKLKLIVRLWRRWSLKKVELRRQRQIAANAALSSLSLGPPVQRTKDQPSAASEFDIDLLMRERYEKHKQSWSRLNVSDAVANVLSRRNTDARCLCWKIILYSQINYQEGDEIGHGSQVMHGGAGPWLHSKIMPSKNNDYDDNDDLLISSPGLSIWRKWVPSQCGSNLACCLSVVKDVSFDNLSETIAGASAILFLVSESIAWNLQKIQLHNLLISIPPGSFLPLLVLSSSYNEEVSDPSSIVVSELGLHDIDKSRVSRFSVVFLAGHKQMETLDGFFSDKQLRVGLQWLANESPLQPDIHCIKTRELVLTHLNPSLDALDKMSDYEVGPNHCISAFNEALDWSAGKIAAAAKANPVGWPCPEIGLLEDLCDEHMVVKCYLPSTGWSLAARIESLLCALRNCKLPSFPDDLSLLDKGADIGNEIKNLGSQLENCLIGYLTKSSGLMGFPLATREAHAMLQRSARLELHDSTYYIVPKWIMVFRRIFNWQLINLSSRDFSLSYVLRCHQVNPTSCILDELGVEGIAPSPYLMQPSLDEIIDAGCGPFLLERDRLQVESFQPPLRPAPSGHVEVAANMGDSWEEETSAPNDDLYVTDICDNVTSGLKTTHTEIVVAGKPAKEADNLRQLLERCNLMQNSLDEKLFIYF